MVFQCNFANEDAIDVGGPYREILTNITNELELGGTLPLLIKSTNHRTDHGENRECFILNSESITPTHKGMFEFLGVWIAYAFRSKSCLPFNIAPNVWKQLSDQALTESDLKSFDTYAWQELQDLRK